MSLMKAKNGLVGRQNAARDRQARADAKDADMAIVRKERAAAQAKAMADRMAEEQAKAAAKRHAAITEAIMQFSNSIAGNHVLGRLSALDAALSGVLHRLDALEAKKAEHA